MNDGKSRARLVLVGVAGTLGFGGAAVSGAGDFANLMQSRFVHCAFYKHYEIDPETGDRMLVEGKSDSLAYYQRSGNRVTRAISTRMAGARDVTVIAGKFLHYIDRVAGMYSVTTVDSCLDYNQQFGMCVVYGAYNLRHFDSRVLTDPDRTFESLRASADPGFCDYSLIGVREALAPASR